MSTPEQPRESQPPDLASASAAGDRRNTRVIDTRMLAGFTAPPARPLSDVVSPEKQSPAQPVEGDTKATTPADAPLEVDAAPSLKEISPTPPRARRLGWALALIALAAAALWFIRREPPRPTPDALAATPLPTIAAVASSATATVSATASPAAPENASVPGAEPDSTAMPQMPLPIAPVIQRPMPSPHERPAASPSAGKPAPTITLEVPNE